MKLFYFGSVCAPAWFDQTVQKSRVKPSASAQSFEMALIDGFSKNPEIELTVVSAESVAMFPGGNRIFLKQREDRLNDKVSAQILPAVNLPGIKQKNHADGAGKLLRKWLRENQNEPEKCVFVYGLYPKPTETLLKICKKAGCKIVILIADLPATMFTYTKSKNLWKRMFSDAYRKKALSIQKSFDGYIYLTEAMQKAVAPEKPYTVVETIADPTIFDGLGEIQKSEPPALMYAGALYKKYGVDLILDTFEQLQTDCRLWLFGSGDYEEEIQKRAERNPKIQFFGRVPRGEILKREQQASLLLNLRNPEEDYTKYSFPSKMVEYLLSGTPAFTTKLPGIPEEYEKYCYMTKEQDCRLIAKEIDQILKDEQFSRIGERARSFIVEQKNAEVQAKKISDFLQSLI